MNQLQQLVYSHLGYLTIQFAQAEYLLQSILIKYLESNEDLLAIYVIEKNNITQNLQLMERFNQVRDRHSDFVLRIIKEIREVQEKRNLFVHGIWEPPYLHEGQPKIACKEMKLKYTKEKNPAGITHSWKGSTIHVFSLNEIEDLINKTRVIIDLEAELLSKLQDEPLNY